MLVKNEFSDLHCKLYLNIEELGGSIIFFELMEGGRLLDWLRNNNKMVTKSIHLANMVWFIFQIWGKVIWFCI